MTLNILTIEVFMNKEFLACLVGLLVLTSCTSIKVSPVESSYKISHICIEKNKRVLVGDFVSVLEEGIAKHGITSEEYTDSRPNYCRYRMTYVATRSWDIVPYLTNAHVDLFDGTEKIGSANYHLRGNGGLALNKWRGTRAKISPLLDDLFEHVKAGEPFDRNTAINQAVNSTDNIDNKAHKLRELHQLLVDGVLTKKEFNKEKKDILEREH